MNFILTGIVFLPLIAAIVITMMKVTGDNNGKVVGIANMASILTFVGAIALLVMFDSHGHGMQFVQSVEWVPMLNIHYTVGVDGISLWLVLLTAMLGVLAVYFSRSQKKNLQYFLALLLVLEGGTLGVFVAMDSILFYVFWELMLVPAYFLIGIWGEGNKVYATTKFVIYTLVGSLLMLVGIIWGHSRPFRIDSNADLRYSYTVADADAGGRSILHVCLFLHGVRDQDSYLSVSQLVAARLCGVSDSSFDSDHRCDVQSRGLRIDPLLPAVVSRNHRRLGIVDRHCRGGGYRLRRVDCGGTEGPQGVGGLFQHQPSRIYRSRNFCLQRSGRGG